MSRHAKTHHSSNGNGNDTARRTTVLLTHKERDILRKLRERYGLGLSQSIRIALYRFNQLAETADAIVLNTLPRSLAGKGRNPLSWREEHSTTTSSK